MKKNLVLFCWVMLILFGITWNISWVHAQENSPWSGQDKEDDDTDDTDKKATKDAGQTKDIDDVEESNNHQDAGQTKDIDNKNDTDDKNHIYPDKDFKEIITPDKETVTLRKITPQEASMPERKARILPEVDVKILPESVLQKTDDSKQPLSKTIQPNKSIPTPKLATKKEQTATKEVVIRFTWEIRLLWIAIGLLALGFILQFFHFILPFSALRFLSWGNKFFLWLTWMDLAILSFYRMIQDRLLPGTLLYSGLLWFATVAVGFHLYRQRRYPTITLGALLLNPAIAGALLWATHLSIFFCGVANPNDSWLKSGGWFSIYTALGLLAVSGSWLLASGFLGILAKRGRGTGYGLEEPEQWEEYRLQPSFFALVAYPILSFGWIIHLLGSAFSDASPWLAWFREPRMWSVLFVWFMLTGYLFSLRLGSKKAISHEQREEEQQHHHVAIFSRSNKLSSLLLFIATVGGAATFVATDWLIRFLRG